MNPPCYKSICRLLLLVLTVTAHATAQPVRLPIGASNGDLVGFDVALNDRFLVVGAPGDDQAQQNEGAIYLFEKRQNQWVSLGKILAEGVTSTGAFGYGTIGDNVMLQGRTLVVGAPFNSDPLHAAGGVFFFDLNGNGTWRQAQRLLPEEPRISGQFGKDVSISGDHLLVGAGGMDGRTEKSGLAFIYRQNENGEWEKRSVLEAPDGAFDDAFGKPVHLEGNRAFIGAVLHDQPKTNAGAVYLFINDADSTDHWQPATKLTAPDASSDDRFGFSMAGRGNLLLIGAPGLVNQQKQTGTVYVFRSEAGSYDDWTLTDKLKAPDGAPGDLFGHSISIQDDLLLIGAPGDDAVQTDAGSVYVFLEHAAGWRFRSKLMPTGSEEHARFGHAIDVHGEQVVITAPSTGNGPGRVFLQNRRDVFETGTDFEFAERLDIPLPYPAVIDMMQDEDGFLWFATPFAGLHLYDGYGITSYVHDPADSTTLSSSNILTLHRDRNQNYWIGTEQGINRFDRAQDRFVRYELAVDSVYPRQSITSILEDRAGRIWIGTNGRLYSYDAAQDQFVEYQPFTGLPEALDERYISGLQQDTSGLIWVLSKNLWENRASLYRVDVSRDRVERFPLADAWGQVGPFLIDRDNRFWIKAPAPLLFQPDEQGILHPAQVPDPRSHWGIMQDRTGTVWLGTEAGFYKIGPNGSAPSFHRTVPAQPDLRSNFTYNFFEDGAGRILVGTGDGVFRWYDSDDLDRKSESDVGLPLMITGITVTGTDGTVQMPTYGVETLDLTYEDYNFSITFAALQPASDDRVSYRYQLEGYDPDWVESVDQRTARYTNVPPGTYPFRVTAVRSIDRTPVASRTVVITIAPPFWKTWWFLLLEIGLVIGLLVAGYRYRVNRLLEAERVQTLVREKQRSEEQARRLAELDTAKSRFFANVSHEFRTPLTLIIGPIEDDLDRDYIPEHLVNRDKGILRNAKRLLQLINQLLDLSKLEAGKLSLDPQEVDLVYFVREHVMEFLPLAEHERIHLQFRSTINRMILPFDVDHMTTIITNLISNAIKFTPEGGKVWVTIDSNRDEVPEDSQMVQIVVKDTGPGIAPEDLERIFNRFEQVASTSTYEGTGIGLALARELVELHGGHLLVESEPGFGAAFIIRLPVPKETKAEPSSTTPGVLQTPPVERTGINAPAEREGAKSETRLSEARTVLLIEDNLEVRILVRRHLERDYNVLEAGNGEAGWHLAQERKPDLIITDVMMPVMDGFELCRRIKSDPDLRHIPVVMLTARATELDHETGLEHGADAYLYKPFRLSLLRAQVQNLIASRAELRSRYRREVVVKPASIVIESEDEHLLHQVIDIIETRMGDAGLNVETLAEAVGLSRRQLYRRLEAATGQTPAAFLKQMRLERAVQYLEAGSGTIAEIAYSVGYKSPSHFSTAFREAFGCPPSEYIKNVS